MVFKELQIIYNQHLRQCIKMTELSTNFCVLASLRGSRKIIKTKNYGFQLK